MFGHAIEENGVVTEFAFTAPEGTNVKRVLKTILKSFIKELLVQSWSKVGPSRVLGLSVSDFRVPDSNKTVVAAVQVAVVVAVVAYK